MYAYCGGNPVNGADPSGLEPSAELQNAYALTFSEAQRLQAAAAANRITGLEALSRTLRFAAAQTTSVDDFLAVAQAVFVPNTALAGMRQIALQ